MRHAPPVRLVLPPDRAWTAVGLLIPALAAGAVSAWAMQWLQMDGGAAAMVAAVAAGAVALALGWRRDRATPELAWDGSRWLLDGRPVAAAVVVDAGDWLLLRLDGAAGPSDWRGLSRHAAGPAWHGLKVALHADTAGRSPAGPVV